MVAAFGWGALGAIPLLVGALIAYHLSPGRVVQAAAMALGTGLLIGSVSFELVAEALETSTVAWVGLLVLAGAAVFATGDWLLSRRGAGARKDPTGVQADGSALAIVLGSVLDGIPESFVLGLTVLQTGSVSAAFLAAVLISNLPEAIGATTGLLANGWSRLRVNLLWVVVTLVSGLSALAGYALLDGASGNTIAFVLSFAAGAILTMLADSMMPEAFANGGKLAGIATTLGFAVAFAINVLE